MKEDIKLDVPFNNKNSKFQKNFERIDQQTYYYMANFLQVFSDESRLKIIVLLDLKEYTVSELCLKLSMSKSAISHQLKTLRDAKIIKYRRVGKNLFYSLSDNHDDILSPSL